MHEALAVLCGKHANPAGHHALQEFKTHEEGSTSVTSARPRRPSEEPD